MKAPAALANADSEPFWAAAAEGRLLLQKCAACGAVQFPPRFHCAACWQERPDWIEASGRGVVESFTIVHRAPLPAFRDQVPYVLVSVLLQEGPRMICTLLGETALQVAMGDPVTTVFPETAEGPRLPCFELA